MRSTVHVSAAQGDGIDDLAGADRSLARGGPDEPGAVEVPQKEGKLLAMLAARSRIYSREYQDGVVEMEAEAPESVVRRVREFVSEEGSCLTLRPTWRCGSVALHLKAVGSDASCRRQLLTQPK